MPLYREYSANHKIYQSFKENDNYKEVVFNSLSGGVIAVNSKRIAQSKLNNTEKEKYKKEYSMCETLFNNGYIVEFLEEIEGRYDIVLNGIPADLKKTKSHNNISHYAKYALKNQKAEIVVFEFDEMTDEIRKKLNEMKRKGYNGKIIYFDSINKLIQTL